MMVSFHYNYRGEIPKGVYSKKSTFQLGHIPERAHFKKSTFQKGHMPKKAHSKGHIPKRHIPKRAHSKKSTFQKGHIPKTATIQSIIAFGMNCLCLWDVKICLPLPPFQIFRSSIASDVSFFVCTK